MKFMSVFYHYLCRPASCYVLAWLSLEYALSVNKRVVNNFISFPESLGSPLLDVWISVDD
jgi:hypothetical protein